MGLKTRFGGLLCVSILFIGGLSVNSCASDKIGELPSVPTAAIITQPSRVAITIDDLPYVMPSKTSAAEGLEIVASINAALEQHNIVATGFVVGQQITPEAIPALNAFVNAGHTVGNHSWSHPDYSTLTAKQFHDETQRTHKILNKWITGPRYYRFPYLKEGEMEEAKSTATKILNDLGYQNAPVTIDNDEWRYNAEYIKAIDRDDAHSADEIARQYIAHMQDRTAHFQTLAQEALGGDVDHILLIHMNRINADHLSVLLDWYVAQGWTFIPIEKALSHSVFSRTDRYSGPRGLSQIERVLGKVSD